MINRLWVFAQAQHLDQTGVLESNERSDTRPPVVKLDAEIHNLILPEKVNSDFGTSVLSTLPDGEKHRHFRSMRSSQALTVSVFGALKVLGRVGLLDGLLCDDGLPAFFAGSEAPEIEVEHTVSQLGEPRPTSIDVWLYGGYRTAIECKFTEEHFGDCSRPRLVEGKDKNFDQQHCDGTYTHQRNRGHRCSLTEIGVKYWKYIPEILSWDANQDHNPCPLNQTYQVVRNILAAVVQSDGALELDGGHALILYDENNPAFGPNGEACLQWNSTKASLKYPHLLRRCSWQRLLDHLALDSELEWLVSGLKEKYGFANL